MLKMIIADDEQIILDGLSRSIDWESYEIQVVGTAQNGEEAKELAEALRPDILITDIRMPGLSGLELMEQIKETLPDTKIILVSAYEEFEYARQAIDLGVMAFITKPMKKQKVLEEVLRVRDKIYMERAERENKNRLEQLYRNNLPILREYYHNNLISGKIWLTKNYSKQLAMYGMEIDEHDTGVFVCVVDHLEETSEDFFEKSIQIIHIRMMEMIGELLPAAYKRTIFQSYNNEVVTIYNGTKQYKETIKKIIDMAEQLKKMVKKEIGISISIGIGKIYPSLKNVDLSYKECIRALHYRLVYGDNTVIFIEDVDLEEGNQIYFFENINEILENMQNILMTGKGEEVLGFIQKKAPWVLDCKSIPYYYIQQSYCQFLSVLLRTMYDLEILQEELYDKPIHLYEILFTKQTLEELEEWYGDLVRRACEAIQEKKSIRSSKVIDMAIQYIEENYSRDLSLGEVAELVELNPSYFSRLFKEETGVRFVEYVRNIKIEMAKELLRESNKKIYVICEELGYQSVQYFSNIFKNIVGMTPMEYKKIGKY